MTTDITQKDALQRSHDFEMESIDTAIKMLEQYVDSEEVMPLIAALAALKTAPKDESLLAQVVNAFNELGNTQGTVLTYAPYVGTILNGDPFDNQ